jgi:hypothetical protein
MKFFINTKRMVLCGGLKCVSTDLRKLWRNGSCQIWGIVVMFSPGETIITNVKITTGRDWIG